MSSAFATVKKAFFDTKAVMSAVDKATLKVLSKFGAFVRTRAKSSIRSRKGASSPGTPPHSHSGLLKRGILFSYDRDRRTVVIGPELLRKAGLGTAPNALEYGGHATRKKWRTQGGRRSLVPKQVGIAARPYMHPAFEKEKLGLLKIWANSVKP